VKYLLKFLINGLVLSYTSFCPKFDVSKVCWFYPLCVFIPSVLGQRYRSKSSFEMHGLFNIANSGGGKGQTYIIKIFRNEKVGRGICMQYMVENEK
jgi:hypothetical protein